eukprot:sb/3462769/
MGQDVAEMKCSEGHVVAVLGLFKRGKTHFLARLCGANFKTDVFQHTRGISIKLPETGGKLNLYVLDSAGKQTPVSIGPALLKKLKHSTVIVVHNFKDAEEVDDLQSMIDSDIKGTEYLPNISEREHKTLGPAYKIVGRDLEQVRLHSNLTFAESGALLHHDKMPSKYHATHTIKENADYVFVHIDAPGTVNLKVEIINNNTELRVHGERSNSELIYDAAGAHIVRDDRLLGHFDILIPLPGSGNLTPDMDIKYHYGVVEIRIPRAVKESVIIEVGPQNRNLPAQSPHRPSYDGERDPSPDNGDQITRSNSSPYHGGSSSSGTTNGMTSPPTVIRKVPSSETMIGTGLEDIKLTQIYVIDAAKAAARQEVKRALRFYILKFVFLQILRYEALCDQGGVHHRESVSNVTKGCYCGRHTADQDRVHGRKDDNGRRHKLGTHSENGGKQRERKDDRLLGHFDILIPLPGSGNLTPDMDIKYHYGVVEIRIPRAVKESVIIEVGPQNRNLPAQSPHRPSYDGERDPSPDNGDQITRSNSSPYHGGSSSSGTTNGMTSPPTVIRKVPSSETMIGTGLEDIKLTQIYVIDAAKAAARQEVKRALRFYILKFVFLQILRYEALCDQGGVHHRESVSKVTKGCYCGRHTADQDRVHGRKDDNGFNVSPLRLHQE